MEIQIIEETQNDSNIKVTIIEWDILQKLVTTKNTKKKPTVSYLFTPVLIFSMPFPLFPYFTQISIRHQSYLLVLEKCRWDEMTGYAPQFSNISAKSNDFFSCQTRSNMCIFWNFVIDFVLKEIKNVKNIIVNFYLL